MFTLGGYLKLEAKDVEEDEAVGIVAHFLRDGALGSSLLSGSFCYTIVAQ